MRAKINLPPRLAAAVAGAAGIFLLHPAPLDAATPSPPVANPVLSVAITTPRQEQWPQALRVGGGIFAWQEAIVAAEIGGLAITALTVDVGSVVKRGQELARLSDATLQAILAQQRANVARLEANLALATSNADRARGLKGSNAMSEQQSTQYLLTEKAVKAELAAAQAALRVEEVHLHQTRIIAADDGIIATRTATLGAVVAIGSDMFHLLRQGRLEWRAELTAEQLAQVRTGMPARLTLSGGQEITATARQIAPTIDANTRRGLVYFDLPPDTPARAGMFAQGEVHLGETTALTVPQSAVVMRDGNAYLFELNANEGVTIRKVTTGRRQGDRVEVTGGVTPTAKVVVSGGAFLHDGDRVRVVTTGSGATP
ncbi:MAG: efflux RND transporter periplasmic adaptor subunit [Magnetococcales bacterium]|nr:efflux RND transporter periplasmic adaptor subunit [Magnetococcales bacterium]